MGLYKRTRKLSTDSRLPSDQFSSGLRFTFSLIHVAGQGGDLGQSAVKRVIEVFVNWGWGISNEFFQLWSDENGHCMQRWKMCIPKACNGEPAAQAAKDNLPDSAECVVG